MEHYGWYFSSKTRPSTNASASTSTRPSAFESASFQQSTPVPAMTWAPSAGQQNPTPTPNQFPSSQPTFPSTFPQPNVGPFPHCVQPSTCSFRFPNQFHFIPTSQPWTKPIDSQSIPSNYTGRWYLQSTIHSLPWISTFEYYTNYHGASGLGTTTWCNIGKKL